MGVRAMNDFYYLNAGSSSSYRNKVNKLFVLIVRAPTFYVRSLFITVYVISSGSKRLISRHLHVSLPRRYLLCPPFD